MTKGNANKMVNKNVMTELSLLLSLYAASCTLQNSLSNKNLFTCIVYTQHQLQVMLGLAVPVM